MNNPIIPKLETQQKYPLFYAEATKTINELIEHITKERGVYSSNIEPDPKEHNIWFNTNDNKLYRWVEEEQFWKTISGGGGSEIVYFTKWKGDFYNGKTYIFDGNKYGSNISRVSAIEPITNFEAILINCDFIDGNNGDYEIPLDFKYISGDTNTSNGIYYVKYIDGYCIVTKLTDNIIIYGSGIYGAKLIDAEESDVINEGIYYNSNYIEIDPNILENIAIHVDEAYILEIPKNIAFCPYDDCYIGTLILNGSIYYYESDYEIHINKLVTNKSDIGVNIIPIGTLITDASLSYPPVSIIQTNNNSDSGPSGNADTYIICNTTNEYFDAYIDSNNIATGFADIRIHIYYGKFNPNITIYTHEVKVLVFTDIPQTLKINNIDNIHSTLYFYCKYELLNEFKEFVAGLNLDKNITTYVIPFDYYDYGDEIEIETDLGNFTIYKEYIK